MKAWTLTAPLLLSLAAVPGCGVPEPESAAPDEAPVAARASALDLQNYKSVGQVICDLIDNLPGGNIVGIHIEPPHCTFYNYDNLYYLGSYLPSTHGQSSRRATAMSDALFCALKDADGAIADGTVHTGVGRFGMLSRIEVPKKDAAARQLVGQRIGTLYAFGVGMDINNQDFVVSFPTEKTPKLFADPAGATGYYMAVKSSTTSWGLAGSAVVGLFTLALDFGQDGYFRSLQNNAFALSSPNNHGRSDPANVANPRFSWNAVYGGCAACRTGGASFCTCPSDADVAQHNAYLNWTDDMYRNLGDGKLPYVGPTGGVSGRYVYQEPSLNWTQLGFTSGGQIDGDPDNSKHDSTHLKFTVKLDYEIISLGVTLGVGFRSGMELSQSSYFAHEFGEHYATVKTTLEAQSNAWMNVHLVIRNPFPFGPDYLIDETFDIFNVSTPNHPTEASRIEYDYAQGFPFHVYSSVATGNRPAQAGHDACVAVPVQDKPLSPPGSPAAFVARVRDAAQDQLFPCHVRMCSVDRQPPTRGHVRKCEWNRATKRLACADTTESCDACQSSADLCDAAGNVYRAKSTVSKVPCELR